MVGMLTKVLGVAFALLLADRFVPGVTVDSFLTAFIVTLIFGVLAVTIKPILTILTLPLTLITFGLFGLVINAGLFWFVASFVEGFTVEGFMAAFLGALLVTVVQWVLSRLTP